MKKWYFGALLALLFISCKETPSEPTEVIGLYDTELFKDVQLSAVFEDSKTFVDLVPKKDIATLEREYLSKKNENDFNLKDFVQQNFADKSMRGLQFQLDTTKNMYNHIGAHIKRSNT